MPQDVTSSRKLMEIDGENPGTLGDNQDEREDDEARRNASIEPEKRLSSEFERSTSQVEENRQRDTASTDDPPSPSIPPSIPRFRSRTSEYDDDDSESNARYDRPDAQTKLCDESVATRAKRIDPEHREGDKQLNAMQHEHECM